MISLVVSNQKTADNGKRSAVSHRHSADNRGLLDSRFRGNDNFLPLAGQSQAEACAPILPLAGQCTHKIVWTYRKMRGQTGQIGQNGQIGQATMRNSGKQRLGAPHQRQAGLPTLPKMRGQNGQNGQTGQPSEKGNVKVMTYTFNKSSKMKS